MPPCYHNFTDVHPHPAPLLAETGIGGHFRPPEAEPQMTVEIERYDPRIQFTQPVLAP
jgi:hypothetical protein